MLCCTVISTVTAKLIGIEVFYQVAGQIILLLYTTTETRTKIGLETVLEEFLGFKKEVWGLRMNPAFVLGISSAITFKTCCTLQLRAITTEKQFVPITSQFFILATGFFSSLRRILSYVCFFTPTLGLFSILYHYKAEQKPFGIWKKYGKNQEDKVALKGLTYFVPWKELDRWDYSTYAQGIPPHYSEYTGTTLKTTFYLFFILSLAQLLSILLIKVYTSKKYVQEKGNFLNKILHLFLSLNFSSPYEDWDQGSFSVKEYRERHRQINKEMYFCIAVNIAFSMIMLLPIWYTG